MTQFAVALDRVIAAPRAAVYRAWLDPEVLARWMGPDGFRVVVAAVDEQIGGTHRVEMLDGEGGHHEFVSVIEELVSDERIVLRFRFRPDGEETSLTLTFGDAEGGGTALRLEHRRITASPPFDEQSVHTGWSQTLDKLQELYEQEERS